MRFIDTGDGDGYKCGKSVIASWRTADRNDQDIIVKLPVKYTVKEIDQALAGLDMNILNVGKQGVKLCEFNQAAK